MTLILLHVHAKVIRIVTLANIVVTCDEVVDTPQTTSIKSINQKDYYPPYSLFLAIIYLVLLIFNAIVFLFLLSKTRITDTMPNIILFSYQYSYGRIEKNRYQKPGYYHSDDIITIKYLDLYKISVQKRACQNTFVYRFA